MKRERTYVIEEDEHLDNLRKIIKRDFFSGGEAKEVGLSLNEYIANFKSNENQFFAEMVHQNQEEWKKAHWWIGKQDKLLMLTQGKVSKPYHDMLGDISFNGVDHTVTKQEALSSFFFNRDKNYGSYVTEEAQAAKRILYGNCRLPEQLITSQRQPVHHRHTYDNADIPSTPILEGRANGEQKCYLGIGGAEYKRLQKPEPEPELVQLMTWGEIESTPLRLSGPSFQIPETPLREEVLRGIHAETNLKKQRSAVKKRELMSKIVNSMSQSRHRLASSIRRIDSVRREKVKTEEPRLEGLLKIEKHC